MLGVFRRNVKDPDPLTLDLPGPEYIPALRDSYLEKHFASIYPNPVIVRLGTYGFLAYSADNNITPSPRPRFNIRSGIYCIYRGHMEMTENRKKAGEGINDVDFLMACYAGVKERGKKAAFEAMQVLGGDYNYILYDSVENRRGTTRGAIAANCWKNMSLFFGLDSDGCCIIADDVNIMEKVCGDCYKPIPKGCGLLIPVSVESKSQPTEAKSLDSSSSKKTSAGEAVPSGGSTSETGSGGKPVAASLSDGSSSKTGSMEEADAAEFPGDNSSKKE